MAFSLGELVWKITGDTSGINKSLDQTDRQIDKTSNGLKGATTLVKGLVGGLAASGIGLFFKKAIGEAMEAEENFSRLNQALASTHGVSGLVIGDLMSLSDELERSTTFTDDQIQSAETMLLTFTKVHKETFPAAMKAIADMATVMKMDLTQATVQVGKALNDPIQGVGALRRVGVQLTDAQEDQIKSFMALNDVTSAQNIILQELSNQFGGQALAATKTFTGQVAQLKKAWDNFAQTVGEAVMPVVQDLTSDLNTSLGIIQDFADTLGVADKSMDSAGKTAGVFGKFIKYSIEIPFAVAFAPVIALLGALKLFNSAAGETTVLKVTEDNLANFAKASDEAASQYVAAYKKISDARKKGTKDEGRTGGGSDPFEKIRKDVNALSGYYKKANADQKTFIEAMRSIPKDQLDSTLASLDSFPPAIKDAAKGFNELSENEAKALQNAVEQYKSGKINLVQFNTLWGSLTSKTREYYDTLNALQPGQLDKINAAIGDSINKSKSFSEQWNGMDFKEKTQFIADQFDQMGASIGNVFSAVAEYVEASYQAQIDALDAAMQAELEAAGIHEETAVEKAEADLARAKESGDQEAILEADKALKKAKIEEKYQKKKAELEYQMEMARWKFSMASAAAAIPLAIMNALASGFQAPWFMLPWFPIGMATLAGASAGVQLAAVAKSKPEAPKFENGGIVGGQSYTGDNVTARVNSGELILNKAQQNNLAGQMSNISVRVVSINEDAMYKELYQASKDGRLMISDRSLVAI